MRRYTILTALSCLLAFGACKTKKQTTAADVVQNTDDTIEIETDDIVVKPKAPEPPKPKTYEVYKGSATRTWDLLHTTLDIKFNWAAKSAEGVATLELTPYYRDQDSLVLDAQAMDIKGVSEVRGNDSKEIPFNYLKSESKLIIKPSRTLKKGEKLVVRISYWAHPEEVEGAGGRAIQGNKGLYFINADGSDPKKARQIWTQGETHHTSCWVPTIDQPNEKQSHDIFITVNDTLQTYSNGKLISSKKQKDGTRIDHWSMKQEHAPYLMAMVIGDFAVFEDKSGKIPLKYIVDKRYAASAKTIFGNTPEMITTYSKLLKTPYPWPKYDQAVVHDFVSGAMENTTLTIHGDMLMLDTRELLDRSYEDVIAHELFHHWFGDLVTCESWANLPLNESFATYGEYLWKEAKYGAYEADHHLRKDQKAYFNASSSGQNVPLIRYHYEKPDDMFDAHSYQKGGCILHMLRLEIGDDAFFKGLNKYLTDYKYQTAEIHNLRQCFEAITGRDLVWFFDQWFFNEGHPELLVEYTYYGGNQAMRVTQKQDGRLFRLPLKVALHYKDSVSIQEIEIKDEINAFAWETDKQPLWIDFDVDKGLLGKVQERKSDMDWLMQIREGDKFRTKLDALLNLEYAEDPEIMKEAVSLGLADPFWNIREEAISLMNNLGPDVQREFVGRLEDIAQNDPKSDVRAAAFYRLKKLEVASTAKVIDHGLNDSSYQVNAAALSCLYGLDSLRGQKLAADMVMSKSDAIKYTSLSILANSQDNHLKAFEYVWKQDGANFYLVAMMSTYLKNNEDPEVNAGILDLLNSYKPQGQQDAFLIYFIQQLNGSIEKKFKSKLQEAEERLKNTTDEEKKKAIEKDIIAYTRVINSAL